MVGSKVAFDITQWWQHPFLPCLIGIDSTTLRVLPSRVLSFAGWQIPLEVCGILWGTRVREGDSTKIAILQAHFLAPADPAFSTSAFDLDRLRAALARPPQGLEAVGYWRSDIRGMSAALTDQDRAFIQQHLVHPHTFVLLIRPVDRAVCQGSFFFCEKGELQHDTSKLQISMLAPESGQDRPGSLPALARNGTAPLLAGMNVPGDADYPATENSALNTNLQWLGGLSLAAFLIAGFVTWKRSNPTPAEPPHTTAAQEKSVAHGLGLQIGREPGGGLTLTWNRDMRELNTARFANLVVLDGDDLRTIRLTPEQLLSGKLAYFPRHEDLNFRLEVFVDDVRSMGESMRVLLPQRGPAGGPGRGVLRAQRQPELRQGLVEVSKQPEVPEGASSSQPETPPTGGPAASLTPQMNRGPASTPDGETTHPHTETGANVAAKLPPPSFSGRSAYSAALPLNPGNTKANGSNTEMAGAAQRSAILPPAAPLTTTPVQESLPALKPPVEGPELATPAGGDVIPPQPLRQVLPNTRPFGFSVVSNNLDVDTLVEVGADGRVKQARVLAPKGQVSPVLTAQIIAAAKQWRFRPAEREGTPVPGTYTIKFKFQAAQ